MFRTYLWIDGDAFDAARFHEAVDSSAGGRVGDRKRMVNGRAEVFQRYWQSNEVTGLTTHTLEAALRNLLDQLRPTVEQARRAGGTRVVVEIVQEYKDIESVAGFFLSVDTLVLLTELGASLDVDIGYDLS